jgi:DNA sulfur modification protein DndE
MSLAEEHSPRSGTVNGDAAIEMSWRTFGGEYSDLYLGLLKQRCLNDGLNTDDETLSEQLKLHLHRGIGYLAGRKDLSGIEDFVGPAIDA